MLLLSEGVDNRIIVTVRDRGILANPFYLFVFTNETTNQSAAIVLEDQSLYPDRYSLFVIPAGTLIGKDWFAYTAYEQTDDTNLDPLLSVGIVETGRAFMLPYVSSPFTSHQTVSSFKAYGK